jgi:hypothetical protein
VCVYIYIYIYIYIYKTSELFECLQTALYACLSAVPEVLDVEFRCVNGLSSMYVSVVSKLWAADSFFCGYSMVCAVCTDWRKGHLPQQATCQTCIVM